LRGSGDADSVGSKENELTPANHRPAFTVSPAAVAHDNAPLRGPTPSLPRPI